MLETLLPYLQASGGVGVWVFIAVYWRIDRRLTKVETRQAMCKSCGNHD